MMSLLGVLNVHAFPTVSNDSMQERLSFQLFEQNFASGLLDFLLSLSQFRRNVETMNFLGKKKYGNIGLVFTMIIVQSMCGRRYR